MRITLLSILLIICFQCDAIDFSFMRSAEANSNPDFQFSTSNSGYYSSPVYFGGNFGIYPRKNATLMSISPIIGARITNRLHLGLNAGIQYEREKLFLNTPLSDSTEYDYESSYYDVSLFLRYFISYRMFIHLEPELINVKDATLTWDFAKNEIVEESERRNIFAGLVGLGYAQPIGSQSIFVVTILYDVVQDDLAPYGSYPFIRGGFNLGF